MTTVIPDEGELIITWITVFTFTLTNTLIHEAKEEKHVFNSRGQRRGGRSVCTFESLSENCRIWLKID